MSCARIASVCAALPRIASKPPWTAGCSVLTRPSIISGNPVRSLTSSTSRPASLKVLRVPPVETSSMPWPASARAKSTTPVLSETEMRARDTRRSCSVIAFIYSLPRARGRRKCKVFTTAAAAPLRAGGARCRRWRAPPDVVCWKVHSTRGMAPAWPRMTSCEVRRGPGAGEIDASLRARRGRRGR